MSSAWTTKAGVLARVAVTLLFGYAGWVKVLDPGEFARAIAGYQLLPEGWGPWLAYGLPWLEIWCAAALWITPPFRRASWALITCMMFVFTLAKASVMVRGLEVACGCTASAEPMRWLDVWANVLWTLVAAFGVVFDRRKG